MYVCVCLKMQLFTIKNINKINVYVCINKYIYTHVYINNSIYLYQIDKCTILELW